MAIEVCFFFLIYNKVECFAQGPRVWVNYFKGFSVFGALLTDYYQSLFSELFTWVLCKRTVIAGAKIKKFSKILTPRISRLSLG